jgi:hypothetical protein
MVILLGNILQANRLASPSGIEPLYLPREMHYWYLSAGDFAMWVRELSFDISDARSIADIRLSGSPANQDILANQGM